MILILLTLKSTRIKLLILFFSRIFFELFGYCISATAAPQGWDRCVNNIRGAHSHLCLKGSVASTFMMGAGGHLRWLEDQNELRRRLDVVLEGIENATTAAGFAAAFAENETMYRENPDYVLSWLTHGLLETEVVQSDKRALTIARNMIDWFNDLSKNILLPEFMPPDRTLEVDVPPIFGANTGHQIYLISQGIIHHSRMATSDVGRQRDVDVIAQLYQEDEWLKQLIEKDEKGIWMKRCVFLAFYFFFLSCGGRDEGRD